jgi:hypothetical protein
VPGTLWPRLYSIRERTLSCLFIRNLEASISTHSPVSPRADSVVVVNGRRLEDLWTKHNAVGKRESRYGPVYAEILGDLPRVENVLELGVLLFDRVSPGGFIIVDDYALKGARAAVHDFLSTRGLSPKIVDIDGSGAYFRV